MISSQPRSARPLRWIPRLPSVLVFAFCLSAASVNQAQVLDWYTDLDEAIVMAEKEQKLVLLHFTAEWSKGCQEVDTFVFSSLQVKRAIHSNVIPVRIDVDEQAELTSQYGIGNVPYDIVITPGKRIVNRRQSPKDAGNYAAMISRLERTIQQIAKDGESTVNQNLDDFQQVMKKSEAPSEVQSFAPERPAHQIAQPSLHSQELNRKMNPMLANEAQQKVSNPFPPREGSADSTRVVPAKTVATGSIKIVNPNFSNQAGNARELTGKLVNTGMQPNLQRAPASAYADFQPDRPASLTSNPATPSQQQYVANPTAIATSFPTEFASDRSSSVSSSGNLSSDKPANLVPQLKPIEPQVMKVPPATSQTALVTTPVPAKTVNLNGPASNRSDAPAIQVPVSTDARTPQPVSAEPPKFALKGNCPMTLIREARWLQGDKQWGCVHRGKTYVFASEEYLKSFLAEPDAYSPLLAGHDPVTYERTGKLVPGSEEHGVFMGKAPQLRVVLFQNQETRREFESNPKKYIQTIRQAMESANSALNATQK